MMETHRCCGAAPAYRKLGGRAVYLVRDLEAWIEAAERRSTHEARPRARLAGVDRIRGLAELP